MRRARSVRGTVGIALVMSGLVIAAPAAHAAVLCNGVEATIVGTAGNDVLVGTDGPDVIWGGGGNDMIDGRDGDDLICPFDTFVAGPGATVNIVGGPGTDTLVLRQVKANAQVTVDLTRGTYKVNNVKGTIASVENVFGTTAPSIFQRITGTTGPNRIEIDNGWVYPMGGGDTIVGTPSLDWHVVAVDYATATSGITVDLNAGTVTGWSNDRLTGVDAVLATYYADKLIGNNRNNYLDGRRGADTIDGRSGNDTVMSASPKATLKGGAGNDRVSPGAGWSVLADGGLGVDTIDLGQLALGVSLDLRTSSVVSGGATWSFTQIESVYGSPHADTITGNDLGNVLDGGDGDDVIFGLSGRDKLFGGPGTDSLDGGGVDDGFIDRCIDALATTTFANCEEMLNPPD